MGHVCGDAEIIHYNKNSYW